MIIDEVKRINGILIINPDSEAQGVPDDPGNRFYQLVQRWVDDGNEIVEINIEPRPTTEELRQQAMMTGVEFNGVMCSAFKEDQWGLASIKDFVLAGNDVVYEFENGNTLELTSSNIAAFEAVWVPYRQSCLKVNFTGS